MACRSRATLETIIDMLGDLSRNLSLFRRWAVLHPDKEYSELSTTLESAYLELIDFCIDAVKYFRRGRIGESYQDFMNPDYDTDTDSQFTSGSFPPKL